MASSEEKARLSAIVGDSVDFAFKSGFIYKREFEQSVRRAITKRCSILLRAVNVDPSALDRTEALQNVRKSIAKETREARVRLAVLRRSIKQIESELSALKFPESGYPSPPSPADFVTKIPVAPNAPGIYFFWSRGVVEYVGQSVMLSNRCTICHHRHQVGDMVSWICFPRQELNFAECYYIGTLRPRRNFGSRSSFHATK